MYINCATMNRYKKDFFMPIHCHTCICTKVEENRQFGPDPKFIIITINRNKFEIGTKHPLYRLRHAIMSRCYNAKASEYNSYQGKGITVYKEWIENPYVFYEWCLNNGWEKGLQLDRIDNNGNYEPGNCQFLTISENSRKAFIDNPIPRNLKLSHADVLKIGDLLNNNISISTIAKDYNVWRTTIRNVKHGKYRPRGKV